MTTARYWTVQAIIDQTAIECGLSAPGAGVMSSTDKNAILLRSLLNTAGQGLALEHHWPALIKEHTITVANPGDTGEYTLPTDFNGLVSDTGFDRADDNYLVPISPGTWQYIKTGAISPTLKVYFRLDQDKFRVETVPADGTILAFEYWSRYWAAATATPTVLSKALVTVSTDVVFFEPTLMVALLKLKFLAARGFDTTMAANEYTRLYDAAISRTGAGRPLEIGGEKGPKWIDGFNVPDSWYGM